MTVSPSSTPLPEAEPQPITSGIRRVVHALVVEADPQAFNRIEMVLRKSGFEPVMQRVGSASALTKELAHGRWDIVISNPLLPGFDGVGPLSILRAGGHDVPCVVIAQQIDAALATSILRAGARDVVCADQLYRLPGIVRRELAYTRQRHAHHRALVELASVTSRLRTLVDAAPIAVVELDQTNRVRGWNAAAQRICGWTTENLLGRPLPLVADGSRTDLETMCAEAQRGRTFTGVETRWQRADGETVELTISLAPIMDTTGNLLLMATPRCEMSRLKRSLDRAQHNEAFGQLAQGIANELGTPLQAIRCELDFLTIAVEELASVVAAQGRPPDVEGRAMEAGAVASAYDRIDIGFLISEIPRSLGKLRTATTRTGQIINAMREVGPDLTSKRQPFDLNRAVECTSTVARSEFRHVADLVLDLQPQLPPVLCVQSEISFVLLNLIINAAHAVAAAASQKGRGAITVATAEEGDWVVVSVNDTGTGIPAADQRRIFEPFFTTKPNGKGIGQGLATSKDLVERHRGTITFVSEEGVGSTFTMRLPRHGGGGSP